MYSIFLPTFTTCMDYLPTFALNLFVVNVGKYTIHGSYGQSTWHHHPVHPVAPTEGSACKIEGTTKQRTSERKRSESHYTCLTCYAYTWFMKSGVHLFKCEALF